MIEICQKKMQTKLLICFACVNMSVVQLGGGRPRCWQLHCEHEQHSARPPALLRHIF